MERLEYMQGGGMGVALFGADIQSVHPTLPGDALCSLYLKANGNFSIKTEPYSGVRSLSLTDEGCELRLKDVMHPVIPVFAREIECFDTVYFGLSTPPDIRKRFFEKGGCPSLLISSRTGDISITLRGNAVFFGDSIRLTSGKSEIFITALTGIAEAGLPGVPPTFQKLYEKSIRDTDIRTSTPELRDIVNRTCHGGVLHSFSENTYYIEEQYEAIKTLCEAGLFVRARDVINFMLDVYSSQGHLPMIFGEKTVSDPFPAIRNAYLALALQEYYAASGDKRYLKSTLHEVATSLTPILDYITDSHLPHMGDEGIHGKDLLLPSKKSEALFESAAEAVDKMSKEVNVRIYNKLCLQNTRKSKTRNRPPRALRTLCEVCGKEGICYVSRNGDYLCPECLVE